MQIQVDEYIFISSACLILETVTSLSKISSMTIMRTCRAAASGLKYFRCDGRLWSYGASHSKTAIYDNRNCAVFGLINLIS